MGGCSEQGKRGTLFAGYIALNRTNLEHCGAPVEDGSTAPFLFFWGLRYISLWLLLSKTTASSNHGGEKGWLGRHFLIPHTSASGRHSSWDLSGWSSVILQNQGFYPGGVQAARSKALQRVPLSSYRSPKQYFSF